MHPEIDNFYQAIRGGGLLIMSCVGISGLFAKSGGPNPMQTAESEEFIRFDYNRSNLWRFGTV